MVVGVIFAVAGVATYVLVANELSDENITVSADAKYFAGQPVNSPWTAYSEAETIAKHALKATGGKTYAELPKDDPLRDTAMQASFLRASLFTSVVAFGVAQVKPNPHRLIQVQLHHASSRERCDGSWRSFSAAISSPSAGARDAIPSNDRRPPRGPMEFLLSGRSRQCRTCRPSASGRR